MVEEAPTPKPEPQDPWPTGQEAVEGVENFLEAQRPDTTWKAERHTPEYQALMAKGLELKKALQTQLRAVAKQEEITPAQIGKNEQTVRYKYYLAAYYLLGAFLETLEDPAALAGKALPIEWQEHHFDTPPPEKPLGYSPEEMIIHQIDYEAEKNQREAKQMIGKIKAGEIPNPAQSHFANTLLLGFKALGLDTEKLEQSLIDTNLLAKD